MKKKVTKRKAKKVSSGQFLSWSSISKDIENLKTEEEKVEYLQKVLNKPEFLKEKVLKKAEERLGEFYILEGSERKAGRLFKNAGNKEMAKECYQTSNFFNRRDEKLLEEKKKELKKLEEES